MGKGRYVFTRTVATYVRLISWLFKCCGLKNRLTCCSTTAGLNSLQEKTFRKTISVIVSVWITMLLVSRNWTNDVPCTWGLSELVASQKNGSRAIFISIAWQSSVVNSMSFGLVITEGSLQPLALTTSS